MMASSDYEFEYSVHSSPVHDHDQPHHHLQHQQAMASSSRPTDTDSDHGGYTVDMTGESENDMLSISSCYSDDMSEYSYSPAGSLCFDSSEDDDDNGCNNTSSGNSTDRPTMMITTNTMHTRNAIARPPASARSMPMPTRMALHAEDAYDCCENNCFGTVTRLCNKDVEEIKTLVKDIGARKVVLSLLEKQLPNHPIPNQGNPSIQWKGQQICLRAVAKLCCTSEKMIDSVCQDIHTGHKRVVHESRGRRWMTVKSDLSMAWLQKTFNTLGEHMPHKNTTYLPGFTKKSVYDKMRREIGDRYSSTGVSYGHFCSLWKRFHPNLVCGKPDGFVKCSICTQLLEDERSATTRALLEEVKRLREVHYKKVGQLRQLYHSAREDSYGPCSNVTAIIIDGMDQAKTNLPHLTREDKVSKPLERVKVHVTGVKLHCHPVCKPMVFLDVNQFPHDSNLTVNILLKAMVLHADKMKPKLHLQLDNCWRENKNRFVFSFLYLLVQEGVFEEIVVNFLPVGHTHEDVDQMFRCISEGIQSDGNIYTLEEFIEVLKTSFKPIIDVHVVETVYNWKEYIIPHTAGAFSGHSKPLTFKFSQLEGQTKMEYRMWAHDTWLPDDGSGLQCLKSKPDLSKSPDCIDPSLERMELDTLEKAIPTLGARIPHPAHEWWTTFFTKMRNIVNTEKSEWEFVKFISLMKAAKETTPLGELPPHLIEIREAIEEEHPHVTIGKQGRTPSIVEDDVAAIQDGQLVAIFTEEKSARPWLGKVLTTNEEKNQVTLHWFNASWTGVCRPAFISQGTGKTKTKVPWTNTVPSDSIILWGFSLTEKGATLPKSIMRHLQDKYKEIDQLES